MDISAIGLDTQEMELGRRWLIFSDVFGAVIGTGIAIAALVILLA